MILLFLACAAEQYDAADLQLDVLAALPAEAERARMCVTGVGIREEGAGNGRLAMTGLPVDAPAEVTVAILDKEGGLLGQSVPVTFDQDHPYLTTDFSAPAAGTLCTAEGSLATDVDHSWLLTIRFTESGW